MERLGLVSSRVDSDCDTRMRRLYKITNAGMQAVHEWTNEAPYDPPKLKHSVLMRVTIGHLAQPGKLKELLRDHIAYCDRMLREAGTTARWTEQQPVWAYARVALKWAERHFVAERELALQLVKDLGEVEATSRRLSRVVTPKPLGSCGNSGTRSARQVKARVAPDLSQLNLSRDGRSAVHRACPATPADNK